MKEGIHPVYQMAEVTCACGSVFTTRSTLPKIRLDICSACHPFYTGRQKLMDTAGRMERFQKRYAKTEGKTVTRKPTVKAAAPKPAGKKSAKDTARILRNAPRPAPPDKPRGAKPGKPKAAQPAGR
ncbi:MAG: 50S ribosomal protein L31 [Elusimicrobiota bacterium]|jgi:large subunit ribosomal protein L31